MKAANNVVYLKQRSDEQFELTLNRWRSISSDHKEELSEKAVRALGIIKHLKKVGQRKPYKYFMGIFNRSQDQVRRYFNELENADLLKTVCEKITIIDGRKKRNLLDFQLTQKGLKELGLQGITTEQTCAAKMRLTYNSNDSRKDKEIEDSSYRAISSISKQEIKNKEQKLLQSTDLLAACDAASQSTFATIEVKKQESQPVEQVKPTKPRIVITAAMQSKTVQLPQAKGLLVEKVSTAAASITLLQLLPVLPITLPAAMIIKAMSVDKEKKRERTHRTWLQETTRNIAKPIEAIILSLTPFLGLTTNNVINTHQRRLEFQLGVTSKNCGTLKTLVATNFESNYMYHTSESETKQNNSNIEFYRALAEKTQHTAFWQRLLNRVVKNMGEIYDPLSSKMREVTMEDIQIQFCNMNYKVDLEVKRIRLQAKGELWIPSFELVYAEKFKDASAEEGYSFELVRTLEDMHD